MPWDKPYRPATNRRLDPHLYTHSNHVYFMTILTFNRQLPFVQHALNRVALDTLREEQDCRNCTVFTYCLMPDHLHFLVSPKTDGISVLKLTDQYKGKTTNRAWTAGWRGKLWQPRYYDHIVRADEDLYGIAQYILNNPVRKSLTVCVEDWPWSGHMNPLP